MKSIDFCIT